MTAAGITRYGERVGEQGAAFRCAECGEVAGVIRLVPAGQSANLGPPLGYRDQSADGVSLDGFLGTSWMAVDPRSRDDITALVASPQPDAALLHAMDWELAPFYCRTCELNYCVADWSREQLFDEGFYDCTVGHCPRGHRQMIDD